ncbi:metallophosphoesterase, partial [Geomonas sp.]|uniref:metallophosphoesterase family protein n=1 Tax=Geomonas sp. TaxID=2651584 RepID=UPI002B4888EB
MGFFRHILFVFLLVPVLATTCRAEPLYQRSMALFRANETQANPQDYSFIVLGDSRDGEAVFRKALKLAKSYHPLFILHGGDYSPRGGEVETAAFLSDLRKEVPDIPVFVVMGNHENRNVFAREIGPVDFTVQSKQLGFALVAVDDSNDALKPGEIDYLRSHLAAAPAIRFVAMHVPPRTESWSWHTFTEGAEELKGILAKEKVGVAFFSHVHL